MNSDASSTNDLVELQHSLATQSSLAHLMGRRQEGSSQPVVGHPPSSIPITALRTTVSPLQGRLAFEYQQTLEALHLEAAARSAVQHNANLLARVQHHHHRFVPSLANPFIGHGRGLIHQDNLPPSYLGGRMDDPARAPVRTPPALTNSLLLAPPMVTTSMKQDDFIFRHRIHSQLYPLPPTAPLTINVTDSKATSATSPVEKSFVRGNTSTTSNKKRKKPCQSSSSCSNSEVNLMTDTGDSTSTVSPNAPDSASRKYSRATTKEEWLQANEDKWLNFYSQLKAYKQRYGDCRVPRGYYVNAQLASWVAEQRKQFKRRVMGNKSSSMTDERQQMLEELGFSWNAQASGWKARLEQLKTFKRDFGHCNVPTDSTKYKKLGAWIKEQRRFYKRMQRGQPASSMNSCRAKILEDVGICWNPFEELWNNRYRELCEYKTINGHTNVPAKDKDNPILSLWCQHQRRLYKAMMRGDKSNLTPSRKKALEDIGFLKPVATITAPTEPKNASIYESDTEEEADDVAEEVQDETKVIASTHIQEHPPQDQEGDSEAALVCERGH